jgi:hypothetical protein
MRDALPLLFAVVLLVGAVPVGAAAQSSERPNPCVGTIEQRPDSTTLMTMQGTRYIEGEGYEKTDARAVAAAPNGSVHWVRDASEDGRFYAYDIDPLSNGNLLFATTEPGITVVEELNASTGEPVSVERYENVEDAHDVDLINGDELVFADKGDERNRIVVYNRTTGEVVWQYRFGNHPEAFPKDDGGTYGEDWTHVNDVDRIAPGEFLVSVRNFNRVAVINRSTKEVTLNLGADGNDEIMDRQHNPQYLETPDGDPTVLIADSLNDRVVEYTKRGGEWEQTWELVGGGLDEPRDADRLPNGNTLVSDRIGHRVMEVTPEGRVVWEFYTPWQTYDAERYDIGDEPGGPTMAEQESSGTKTLTNSAGFSTAEIETCAAFLRQFSGGGVIDVGNIGSGGGSGTGGGGDGGLPVLPILAGVVVLLVVLGGVVVYRER